MRVVRIAQTVEPICRYNERYFISGTYQGLLNPTMENEEADAEFHKEKKPKDWAPPSQKFSVDTSPRRKYSRNQKMAIKYLVISLVLGAVLFITVIGWVLTAYKLSSTNSQYLEYQVSTRQTISNSQELTARVALLEQEITSLQEEKATLIQNRIPNLLPLVFDSIVHIGQLYLKNISFTQTGTEKEKKFEYRAILQNDRQTDVTPDVDILLFDSTGVQIGMAKLMKEHSTSETGYNGLKPGESRAYSSQVHLNRKAEPAYFLLDVK